MEKEFNDKSKMKELTRLIVALVVLLGIAGSFILYLSLPLIAGKTIILATRPIDPFDILRGQYITINYDISRIPSLSGIEQGDTVYVVLKEDENKIARYQSESLSKPNEPLFIKGTAKENNGETIRIEYEIEQYFFERNAELPRTNLTVEVKISSSGQARISNLLFNGKPVEIKYKKPTLTS